MTRTDTISALLLALALAVGAASPAAAHKVVAGAYASGDRIEGEIGFSDGSMAKDVAVEVFAEDGRRLGETRTGADGTFVFVPTERVVHLLRADLGGGHVAEVRLEVADLPQTVAAPAATAASPATPPTTPATTPSTTPAAAPAVAPANAAAAPVGMVPAGIGDLQKAALAEAVRNELKPLRREIIALKEKNDLQSVLGGIGYIVGLFGLWFFIAGRRLAKRSAG